MTTSTSNLKEPEDNGTASVEETSIEELDMVHGETDHLMDLIASLLPEKSISSSTEKAIDCEVVKDQIIEVLHIDFIFGDRLSFSEDCDPLVKIRGLKH